MRTILVTGANGFVGHHLVKELHANGYEVISTGREASEALKPYVRQHYIIDLTDGEAVKQLDFTKVSGVIHLAGLAAVGPSFDEPLQYIQVNMGMEINLYEVARQQRANPRFIIISSGSLYDPRAKLPLTESSPVKPSSPYAISKLGQEQFAAYYSNRDFESIIARPFNHIGPGQNLGFLLPDLTKQIIDAQREQTVTLKVGNLSAQRDYTDVRDIARAYRLLYEKGRAGEIYNICTGQPSSGNQILDMLLQTTGAKLAPKEDPELLRPVDTPVIYGSNAKIKHDTGWEPSITIEQTVTNVVADWSSR